MWAMTTTAPTAAPQATGMVWRGAEEAAMALAAYIAALAWSIPSRGIDRWILLVAAVAPWWVLEAVRVGQVVPLVAAGVAISWRLLRENRNVAAGIALSVVLLKPNTAFVVPL